MCAQSEISSVCSKNLSPQNSKLTDLSVKTLEFFGHFFPSGANNVAEEFHMHENLNIFPLRESPVTFTDDSIYSS